MLNEVEEDNQEPQEFKPYHYSDPPAVNYWQKKCKCKAEAFTASGPESVKTISGSRIWTAEHEEGPICKLCLKAWRLVLVYPEY